MALTALNIVGISYRYTKWSGAQLMSQKKIKHCPHYGSAVEEKPSQRYEFIQAAIDVLTDTRNWSLSISIDHTEPTVSSWKL